MASQPPTSLTAADLMTAAPRTCSTFSTVLEAVLIFRDADCGAVATSPWRWPCTARTCRPCPSARS
jgi:hypothetical protein